MCQVILNIQRVVVKGYHECSFSVEVSERFVAQKKRGDRGNVLKVVDSIQRSCISCYSCLFFILDIRLSSPVSSPGGFTV